MIGLAAAALLLGTGRVMGASGIVGGLIDGSARGSERARRVVFVLAAIATPALFAATGAARVTAPVAGPLGLVAAGLLVGFGTRLANGCTSGHGVCGISRLSRRGIVATLVYIGAGMATVAVLNATGLRG